MMSYILGLNYVLYFDNEKNFIASSLLAAFNTPTGSCVGLFFE